MRPAPLSETESLVWRDGGRPGACGRARARCGRPSPPLVGGVRPAAGRVVDDRDEGVYVRYPTSFGEGLAGEIYIASLAGPVYRLTARAGGGRTLP